MWGAARHDRATGVHRPLVADILYFAPLDDGLPWVQAQLDLVGLGKEDHSALVQTLAEGAGITPDQVILAYSHSHAAGFLVRDRTPLPGGELIQPYLAALQVKLKPAAQAAVAGVVEATLTYGQGRCNLAANRDYWDDEHKLYACGFNPDAEADDTVLVVAAVAADGRRLATIVNYACHPTSLAWDNTLLSPDYVGALRAEIERATGAPCVFTLEACGDLGPRQGFSGDLAVADRNGRQLAYAALSALEALDPPGQDYCYAGPVVSGATLGAWEHTQQSEARAATVRGFAGVASTIRLAVRARPDAAKLEQELATWLERQHQADAAGDVIAARNAGAQAERARRWLLRLAQLPPGDTLAFPFSVRRMGDAFWVSTAAEPYNALQMTLRRRFPTNPVVVTVLAGELSIAYLLPKDRYGKGLYQEEPSILAPGCLEQLTDAIIEEMTLLAEND
jgi:hypothetical protein